MIRPPFEDKAYFKHLEEYHAGVGGVWTVALMSVAAFAVVAIVMAVRLQSRQQAFQISRAFNERTWHWYSDLAIGCILGCMWCFVAIPYFWQHFSSLGPVAFTASAVALVQGIGCVALSLVPGDRGGLTWRVRESIGDPLTRFGITAIVYAVVLSPLLAALQGRGFPHSSFLTPTPICTFTFGVFLLSDGRGVPMTLLFAPCIWALCWVVTVFHFRLWEDLPSVALALITPLVMAITAPDEPLPPSLQKKTEKKPRLPRPEAYKLAKQQ